MKRNHHIYRKHLESRNQRTAWNPIPGGAKRQKDSRRGEEKTSENEGEDRTDSAIMGNGNPADIPDL